MIHFAFIVVLFILFAMFNGWVIVWQQSTAKFLRTGDHRYAVIRDKATDTWHMISVFMKLFGVGWLAYATYHEWTIYIWYYIGILLLVVFVMYTGYNMIINYIMKQVNPTLTIWHIDGRPVNQWIVKTFGKVVYWLNQTLILAGGIVLLIFSKNPKTGQGKGSTKQVTKHEKNGIDSDWFDGATDRDD